MKNNLIARTTLAAIGLALFITMALPAQATQCSLANVAGSYGYTASGFVAIAPSTFVPAAAAGRVTFDGHGHVNGTQTRVVAGSSLDETYSGTYSVRHHKRPCGPVNVQKSKSLLRPNGLFCNQSPVRHV